jgi:hypothetical protein
VTEGSRKWFAAGERIPPTISLLLAVAATLGALGGLLLYDGDAVEWKQWLRIGSTAAQVLFAAYFWVSFARRRRG